MNLLVNDISQRETMPYVFHDRYVFRQRGKIMSVRVNLKKCLEYLICAICPVSGDYEPGEPECGFLFPAYMDGGAVMNYVDVYQKNTSPTFVNGISDVFE